MSSGVFLDQPVGPQHAAAPLDLPSEGSWSENSVLFVFEFHPGPGPPPPPPPPPQPSPSDEGYCFLGTSGGPDLEVVLPARCNVRQLRFRLYLQALEQNWLPDPLGLLDPEEHALLYARGRDWYEIYDDHQIVRTLNVPWSRDAVSGRAVARVVVVAQRAAPAAARERRRSLARLIGHDLDGEAAGGGCDRLGELMFTRRKLAAARRRELDARDPKAYATEPWTTPLPVPDDLRPRLGRKLPVTLHHLNRISFTVKVDLTATPAILLEVFRQVAANEGLSDCGDRTGVGGLVLKVSGREEFLTGDFVLSDFLWVRQCLRSERELHLSVVPVEQLLDGGVDSALDWPLVDSFTGQSSSHQDLCLEGKEPDDVFMVSLWDCDRRLRVKLLGFDVPTLPPANKAPQSAYVEASILLGNKVLSSVVSSPKPFSDEVLWNEWLVFDVLLRDLPRGTKLGLTINTNDGGGGAAKETKPASKASDGQQKAKGKVLYFVNLLLIDHRSLLSQGPHTLHMWSYPELEEEAFAYPADKLSSATNPDVSQSMAITVLLDRYNFPVVLPSRPLSLTDEEEEEDRGSASSSSSSSTAGPSPTMPGAARPPAASAASPGPDTHGASPPHPPPALPPKRRSYVPNSALSFSEDPALFSTPDGANSSKVAAAAAATTLPARKPPSSSTSPLRLSLPVDPAAVVAARASSRSASDGTSGRLRRFREESFRYASNLPQYLRSVDWVSRAAVDDVHWLLGHWEPAELELAVALELLGVDFVDERVRRLAVRRLESLSNDEVLRYLLQLVQILKVEPYHDSFLARYLIRRALRSKRIGHFFFWYVRSEVAGCPYFRQRMAVILEAYLLGCGKAMLDGFAEQIRAVEALELVAKQMKQLYSEKTRELPPTASLKLQELLRNADLPSEFLVPFDPRIKAGRILLDKCKVMASKKKPLWLEFCSMPSPVPTTPVGVIFKEGDDLRQDMLVIQTLMVMDSIWQEKSLDLCLVPYGCISTGQNIGMIEIVRDAATIATVQKARGGSAGAFMNDALFEWLKSKGPFQEIHCQSVERFVNSCAGYCVATYVLGIGDRHNDNIMVTDQGNLFHIDFGHILGHRKRFLGVNRERVPFVLTPDFMYVMGRVKGRTSLYFQRFRDTCVQAYLSLRSHSRLLVTLFSLMLLTGIPELSSMEDMRYLREALQEERSEEVAREHFLQQIALCEQGDWTVQTNWWFHMLANG